MEKQEQFFYPNQRKCQRKVSNLLRLETNPLPIQNSFFLTVNYSDLPGLSGVQNLHRLKSKEKEINEQKKKQSNE